MSKGKIFRDALKRGMVTAPGCFECIGARAIERGDSEAAAAQIPLIESQIAQTQNSLAVLIGRDPGSVEEFAETWAKIARRYRNQPNVIFGLMNEPNKQSAEEWLVGANQAIAACSHEWIFSLDADERCTPKAAEEIRATVNNPAALDAYWMPRRNYFMGRYTANS